MRRLPADGVCHFRGLKVRGLESVREKTGNIEGRICFTKTNSVAAGGANASAFGPTAASTSIPRIFTVTASYQVARASKRHMQPCRKPVPTLPQRPYPQNNLYPAARHMNVTSSPIALGSASMTNIPIANQSNANPITFFIICPASGRWFGIILCPDFKFVHHFQWNLRNSEYP